MSEPSKSSQTQSANAAKPTKSSLVELLGSSLDSRSILLGATSEELGEGAAPEEAADAPADAEVAASTPVAEEKPEIVAIAPTTARPARRASLNERGSPMSRKVGLLLAVVGVLLAAAPHLSPRIAQFLGSSGDLQVHSATLIVAGLLLVSVGALRPVLREIRSSLDVVGQGTERLDSIVADGRTMVDQLKAVKVDNAALTEDVVKLGAKIKRLTEIVSSPEYTVSTFRLAASVDQLDKHVETYMKEQFATLQKLIAERAAQSAAQVTASLNELRSRLDRQLEGQSAAVDAGFEAVESKLELAERSRTSGVQQLTESVANQLSTCFGDLQNEFESSTELAGRSAQEIASRFDRLGTRLDEHARSQQDSLEQSREHTAEAARAATGELGASLEQRVENIGARIEEVLDAGFEALESKLELAERSRTSGVQQLTESVANQLSTCFGDLQNEFESTTELAGRSAQEIASRFDRLGTRLDEHARSQQDSFEQNREHTAEAARAATGALGASLEQRVENIGARIEEVLDAGFEALESKLELAERSRTSGVQQLTESVANQLSTCFGDLQNEFESSTELTGRSAQEIASRFDRLGTRLDEHARSQQDSFEQNREHTAEAARAAKGELGASLEQLRTSLERLARDHADLMGVSSLEARDAAEGTRRTLDASFGQLQAHLEKHANEHTAALHDTAEKARREAAATKREFDESLGQLRAHLEGQALDHAAALYQSAQDAQQSSGATRREIASSVEQIGARIERALDAHSNELTSDMMEIAEMYDQLKAELRTCIAESMDRLVIASAASAPTVVDAEPTEPTESIESAEPTGSIEPAESAETAESIEPTERTGWAESAEPSLPTEPSPESQTMPTENDSSGAPEVPDS